MRGTGESRAESQRRGEGDEEGGEVRNTVYLMDRGGFFMLQEVVSNRNGSLS